MPPPHPTPDDPPPDFAHLLMRQLTRIINANRNLAPPAGQVQAADGNGADDSIEHIQPLKVDRIARVDRIRHRNRDWVVKQHRRRPFPHRLARLLGRSRAQREQRGAQRLTDAGVRTNPPRAIGWAARARVEVTLLSFINGWSLDHLLDTRAPRSLLHPDADDHARLTNARSTSSRLRVAEAIGGQIGRLARAGLVNRDHKPGNLLIDDACLHHGDEPVIIDAGVVRPLARIDQVHQSLALLRWETHLFGVVSARELAHSLRAVVEACPMLGEPGPGSRKRLRRAVEAHLGARPLPQYIGAPRPSP